MAWMPFVLMSILLMLTGLVRQSEGQRKNARSGADRSCSKPTTSCPIPRLDKQALRDAQLLEEGSGPAKPEPATFNFAWLTAPGTAVFVAALLSMVLLRMNRRQIGRVFKRTFIQMKIPIPTIAFMLGLSYVTRYAGMDATLGFAFASTGLLYPFFAPLLGWLGVFLTGTDAGSNALFGSLQKITATQIYNAERVPASQPGTGPGADLHGQQHRRRHGQDDRRPEHLRGDGGDEPARQGSRHLQGGRLAQHHPGRHRRPADAGASVCVSVYRPGSTFAEVKSLVIEPLAA